MNKLKIEKGASRMRRTSLKATIDAPVADDLELMCEWSENDSSYLVNLLLGFAIAQSDDFQKYKIERVTGPAAPRSEAKQSFDTTRKVLPSASSTSPLVEKGATA
jgi:hypothetical protein